MNPSEVGNVVTSFVVDVNIILFFHVYVWNTKHKAISQWILFLVESLLLHQFINCAAVFVFKTAVHTWMLCSCFHLSLVWCIRVNHSLAGQFGMTVGLKAVYLPMNNALKHVDEVPRYICTQEITLMQVTVQPTDFSVFYYYFVASCNGVMNCFQLLPCKYSIKLNGQDKIINGVPACDLM
jgi:hypothetical protein